MILNAPEIYYIRLLLSFFFLTSNFYFKLSKNIKYLMIIILWLSGLATSPFTETDYLLYLDYINIYKDFPSEFFQNINGIHDLIKIDKFGYYFLYHLHDFFTFDGIFQIFISLIFFLSVVLFAKISGIDFNEMLPLLLIIPLTSTYIFSTDWYLRQGIGVAFFIMALSILCSNFHSIIRYSFFFFLSLTSILWHLSMLYLLFILFLSIILMKSSLYNISIFQRKISSSLYLFVLSIITFLFIFPLRYFNIIFDVPDIFDSLLTYKSVYENSEWQAQRPGFGFILHFILIGFTSRLLLAAKKDIEYCNARPVTTLIPILWFTVSFSLLAMSITSLGTRFLLPFSYFMTLASMTFVLKIKNLKAFNFIFYIFVILFYSLFIVYENGGNPRY
jgi:hypothetical protein